MAKNYSVSVKDGEVVSVQVDGATYDDPDQIPDPEDRAEIEMLIAKTMDEDLDKEFENFDKEFENFDQEFQELEKQSQKFPIVIVAIFLFVAAITISIAIFSGISASRTMAKEQSAPGTVVDMIVRKSQGGYDSRGTYQAPQDYYYPVVEFSLPNGTTKTVQLGEGSWPPAYEKGEAVTILYDPDKPINARIQSTASNVMLWLLPGITGTLGIAFLIAALGVWWFLRPTPAKVTTSQA